MKVKRLRKPEISPAITYIFRYTSQSITNRGHIYKNEALVTVSVTVMRCSGTHLRRTSSWGLQDVAFAKPVFGR
jgi:hypothetical protein